MCTAVRVEPSILYFGTPVALVVTLNEDGSPNVAPMSSAWTLGQAAVLGLGASGKTVENLQRTRECTLNLPSDRMWQAVERLAPLTGKSPVPPSKASAFRYEPRKFEAAGLTPAPSDRVGPPRIAECPLQFEAVVEQIHGLSSSAVNDGPPGAFAVEVRVVRAYGHDCIARDTHHIDPNAWRPLIYNFRHYFGLGDELGKSFRAET